MNPTVTDMELKDAPVSGLQGGEGNGRWWALVAIVLSGLVVGLDITILMTALPTLATKLQATTSQLQWFSDAYTLALGGLLLPAGVLGDRYGRRSILLIGLALFGVASIVASQVTSANGLITIRAVMGVGAAIIIPLTLSILPSLFTEQERPRAIALTAAGAFLGLPLGPLVAGWLLTNFAWGSIFLINGPVVLLALAGVWFLVPESKDPDAPPLDWVGAVMSVAAVTSLVFGIIEEPGRGWTDDRVVAALTVGVVALAAFVAWDVRRSFPLVDLHLFVKPRFTWPTVAFIIAGFALTGVLFVLTPYLQIVQGNDAQATGIRLLPMILAIMIGGLSTDRLAPLFGSRIVIAGGLMVTALGLVLLSRASTDTGYGLVAASLTIAGLGVGLALPTALDAVLGAVPEAQTGAGMALSRTLQQIGASFGVAILGSILNNAYRGSLSAHLANFPPQIRSTAEDSIAGAAIIARHLPQTVAKSLLRAGNEAYSQGMSDVLLVCSALMLGGALLVFIFMPARKSGSVEHEGGPGDGPSLGGAA